MGDRLENLIRQWGWRPEGPLSAPPRRGDSCLSFAEAEQMARSVSPPRAELSRHVESCACCRKLLADFQEVLAEVREAPPPRPPALSRFRRLQRLAALALAASVLLAAGIGVFFLTRRPAAPTAELLASAEVRSPSGITQKGAFSFASGDQITFGIRLRRESYVMLLNADPAYQLWALKPKRSSPDLLVVRLPKGRSSLGPHTLDQTLGREAFLIVAFEQKIGDIPARIRKLQSEFERKKDAEALADSIRAWPAEVKIISFVHVSP